ncbi:hypothetical protein EII29_01440 [Leptotrichia sp. OH3620_COT-345]|uniref:hypothetical protein n=1 Tax=Leptotrichia sp. OH3620_COT-345 TaxID=2491048 RepID=UPI000F6459F3|nr:hypothetical protein [Leptotrichia sp. OH3620_COT-345]RRD40632.1 hypothetical protein EII29_01440 [Leptotrichia sp. OH3620_COT-345]
MKIYDREKFSDINLFKKSNTLPVTSEERIQYTMEYIINTRNYIKVENLSKILFISGKTLAEDIKEAKK